MLPSRSRTDIVFVPCGQKGGIKMNSCIRCGEKLSHNYLVAMFRIINEKRERVIVCLKCKEILNKKGK
ncbi:MAG: hypothetical protein NTU54_04625 [Candidatus Omnitrophica bacterium]|nr:hypothetical protein [Candidatus Omnitrophota bacterium]